MTAVREEIRYEDYRNMVFKRAHQFARAFGITTMLEDIIAEGEVIFCQALQAFDPSLGSFSTYLSHKLERLKKIIKKKFLREFYLCLEDPWSTGESQGEQDKYSTSVEALDNAPDSRWDPQAFQSYYEEAREQLSREHFTLFEFCLTITRETLRESGQSRCRYVVNEFSRVSGVSKFRSRLLWKDLRDWWGKRIIKGV